MERTPSPVHKDVGTLISLLQQFRLQLEDPLLPLPDPKVIRRRLFHAVSSRRKSRRISVKDKGISMSIVKKAQKLLMKKLGLC